MIKGTRCHCYYVSNSGSIIMYSNMTQTTSESNLTTSNTKPGNTVEGKLQRRR